MNMTQQHSRVRWAYRRALRGAYPHLLQDSWGHSRSWGSSRKSSSWSSSDSGLQTEAKRTLPHKPQTSGASSAAKKKKQKNISSEYFLASRLGMTSLDAEPRLEGFSSSGHLTQRSWWVPCDVADTLSTHWPGSESRRRTNSWFRTSSIFLLVKCTHWIL